jgi:mono/diheme cytochrome c family protein
MKLIRFLILSILVVGLLAACAGVPGVPSTRSYLLTTAFENGELVYMGVGGEINGVLNPTLQAKPGETITVTLINGGEGTHDIFFPELKVKSKRVTEKGESVSVTFAVPTQAGELEYHDSVANHAKIGMVGSLQVSGPAVTVSLNQGTGQSDGTNAQAAPQDQAADSGEAVFKLKCAACHTVGGGKLTGPDLKGVTKQRDLGWLAEWIKTPDKMLAAEDPIAMQLLAEFNNIPMPNMGLSDDEVADLLAYFQSVDGTAPPAPEPTQVAAAPTEAAPSQSDQSVDQSPANTNPVLASAGDPAYGEKLFTGAIPLANGGTPCIACHSVSGTGAIGGGTLGPDHTQVYTRYGREGLAAALGTLPFPSMQGIYANRLLTESEQAALLAYYEAADQQVQPRTQANLWTLFGAGTGVATVLLVGMLFFWPRQRMSLSQRLRKNGKL